MTSMPRSEDAGVDLPRPAHVHESLDGVRPQGSYLAKRCAFQVALDDDPPPNVERLEPTPADQRRMQDGIEFERTVGDRLVDLLTDDVLDLRGVIEDWDAHVAATMSAMRDGEPIILDARLEPDVVGRRAGLPDLLVRGHRRDDGGWGYLPVDIKNHGTVTTKKGDGFGPARTVALDGLGTHPSDVAPSEDEFARRSNNNKDDLHQLAHYWRMLEAHGLADDSDGAWGAVVGSDERCTWYRLDGGDVAFQSWTKVKGRWTALERYDREFGFRLDVLARSADGREPGVVPAWISRLCNQCHWREYCTRQMVDVDEVTLLPTVSWKRRGELHDVGLHTRTGVARLDHAASALGDLPRADAIIAAALDAPGDTSLTELATQKAQRTKLATMDVATAGAVGELDDATVEIVRQLGGMSGLQSLVEHARSDVMDMVLRSPDVEEIHVVRADVEVDLDIESFDDEVYLWGVRLHDPAGLVGPSGVSYIDDFADLSRDFDHHEVFQGFWSWYEQLVRTLRATDATHAVYSWSFVEEKFLRRYGQDHVDPDVAAAVARLVADTSVWVDLEKVVKAQLVLPTRGRTSIKVVAPRFAGFTGWEDVRAHHGMEAIDGDESRDLFAHAAGIATDPSPNAAEILFDYNHADLDAMWSVREWLSGLDDIPSAADVMP